MIEIIEHNGEKYNAETGELINEVEQVEVEIIEDNLPDIVCNGGTHIKTNTEQLKRELIIHLEKYDIEVTEETEKDASKQATELNKLAKDLNSKRLEVSKLIKRPADELKDSIDELIALVQEKRIDILEKVEVFKSKRMLLIETLLNQELDLLYVSQNVSDKYQVVDIKPLIKETSLSKTKLSKAALETLESMVRKVKALEDAVTIRELQLEMICTRSGLSFPIEINEVQHIIQEDNYQDLLNGMIENRLAVQEKMKAQAKADEEKRIAEFERVEKEKQEALELARLQEREKEKQEREQREAFRIAELERVEREKQEAIQAVKDEAIVKENQRIQEIERKTKEEQHQRELAEKIKIEEERKSGKKTVRVSAIFEVEVNVSLDNKTVIEGFREKLNEHFNSLLSVEEINQF
ncbi:DUF1351 domain-containing protein [Arcobacter sp. s6]|uniref:DUF1351 domain-containing protein n=1 Tax=Arcobacter sp. s6 TaxID=3230363 RepID=UPI0034A09CDC